MRVSFYMKNSFGFKWLYLVGIFALLGFFILLVFKIPTSPIVYAILGFMALFSHPKVHRMLHIP